jgi:hypothetical protein
MFSFMIAFTISCVISLGGVSSTTDCGCELSPPGSFVVCPQGDGPTLEEAGCVIVLTYPESTLPEVPASYGGCTGTLVWCGGTLWADSAIGANKQTTVSGSVAGGGYDTEIMWRLARFVNQECMFGHAPITVVSPDINADLIVDIIDLSIFAVGYTSPPKPYDPRFDMNQDRSVDIIDFSILAQHYLHRCSL